MNRILYMIILILLIAPTQIFDVNGEAITNIPEVVEENTYAQSQITNETSVMDLGTFSYFTGMRIVFTFSIDTNATLSIIEISKLYKVEVQFIRESVIDELEYFEVQPGEVLSDYTELPASNSYLVGVNIIAAKTEWQKLSINMHLQVLRIPELTTSDNEVYYTTSAVPSRVIGHESVLPREIGTTFFFIPTTLLNESIEREDVKVMIYVDVIRDEGSSSLDMVAITSYTPLEIDRTSANLGQNNRYEIELITDISESNRLYVETKGSKIDVIIEKIIVYLRLDDPGFDLNFYDKNTAIALAVGFTVIAIALPTYVKYMRMDNSEKFYRRRDR